MNTNKKEVMLGNQSFSGYALYVGTGDSAAQIITGASRSGYIMPVSKVAKNERLELEDDSLHQP